LKLTPVEGNQTFGKKILKNAEKGINKNSLDVILKKANRLIKVFSILQLT